MLPPKGFGWGVLTSVLTGSILLIIPPFLSKAEQMIAEWGWRLVPFAIIALAITPFAT